MTYVILFVFFSNPIGISTTYIQPLNLKHLHAFSWIFTFEKFYLCLHLGLWFLRSLDFFVQRFVFTGFVIQWLLCDGQMFLKYNLEKRNIKGFIFSKHIYSTKAIEDPSPKQDRYQKGNKPTNYPRFFGWIMCTFLKFDSSELKFCGLMERKFFANIVLDSLINFRAFSPKGCPVVL